MARPEKYQAVSDGPELDLINRQRKIRIYLGRLRAFCPVVVRRCLATPPGPDSVLASLDSVGVAFLSDRMMGRLHQRYLEDPAPTDVITFPYGEILIGAETAARVAAELGHPLEKELLLYLVHGLLHLHGYDDLQPGARREMHQVQAKILKAVLNEVW